MNDSLWAIGNDRVRVVFPFEGALDTTKANILFDALSGYMPLAGLPSGIMAQKRITISLAAKPREGVDGRAIASHQLIILALVDAFEWHPAHLKRVIGHELAHIGLGILFNYDILPIWFREGFAEWVAGGLTCEGEARVRLDLMTRRHKQTQTPSHHGPNGLGRSRLAYDLYATFFDYLEERGSGVVSTGVLLTSIKRHGIELGLSYVLGSGLEELEDDWQGYLLDRYDGLPEGFSCDPGT